MAGIQGVEEVKEKGSKGCRNPRSGEARGSMTPKGAGAQKWQKLKGWSFACRASFAILRPSFVFLRASLRFLRAGFPFPARPRVFSARALPAARASHFPSRLCLSARDFALPRASFAILRASGVCLPPSFAFPSRLRLSPRKLNLSPCAFRRMRVFYVFLERLSRNFIFFIFMSE